jgi:muramoyltetrapeptide carboxypeptidase LdcA involved in peptidoglycan recycling
MLPNLIRPPKLHPGDKVATVTLSWGGPGQFPRRYEAGKQQLQDEFGLTVVEMPHTQREAEWVRRHPEARAADLMMAFADPSVKGIISTVGGDDSIRILPYLDLDVIRANPKVFMGFSDTVITHLACLKAGLATFYGPAILAGFAENGGLFPYMVESVRRTLFSSAPIGRVPPNTEGWTVEVLNWAVPENQLLRRTLTPCEGWQFLQGSGIRRGPLLGGCLEVLDWLRGTDIWPPLEDWSDAILFLETSEDAPPASALGYFLRCLVAMGVLGRLAGILLARPGGDIPPRQFEDYGRVLREVVYEEQGLGELPIVTHMDFGHTDPVFVLPYGALAEINCERQEFAILEGTVTE